MHVRLVGMTFDAENRQINSIKAIRAATGFGLKEAKFVFDRIRDMHEQPVIGILDSGCVAVLREAGFAVRVVDPDKMVDPDKKPSFFDQFIAAINRMPTNLTVGDVAQVMSAIASVEDGHI